MFRVGTVLSWFMIYLRKVYLLKISGLFGHKLKENEKSEIQTEKLGALHFQGHKN